MYNVIERDRIHYIFSSLTEGILVFDSTGKVVMSNKSAGNIFLMREDTLIGLSISDFNSNEELNNVVLEVLTTGREIFIETSIEPDLRIFRIQATPVKNSMGVVVEVIVIFKDVTSTRNFEQMRSEFVANVSHELRTPLTSIKGFVETLLDGEVEDKALIRRFLTIIDNETNRLSRLIEELLTLSSIESKERIIKPKPVCMGKSIRSVLNILGPQISEKKLHIEFIYPNDLSLIHADEDLLGQVLINLLDNAIKYTNTGGKIIIRSYRDKSRVITLITDTGMGIPSDSIPRIFERFYRVDKARSRSKGGTGLGLSIVKHIVESHGGEVFVQSEIGKGSTFGFSFLAV